MPDARGLAYQQRVATLLKLYGEPFSLVTSGSGVDRVAVMTPIGDQYINTFYDANEAVGLVRPTLTVYLAGNMTAPLVNDVFFRDSRLWTVRKVHAWRVVDVIVFYLALCD